MWIVLAVLGAWSCASSGTLPFSGEAFRLSQVASAGDPARRASQRLVLQGLDEDERESASAVSSYERALQVDPTNPYAYLALARYYVEWGEPERALAFLDKTEALLGIEADPSLGVEAHLDGLRGAALLELGRSAEARPLLSRARTLAPGVWADGRLDADELR